VAHQLTTTKIQWPQVHKDQSSCKISLSSISSLTSTEREFQKESSMLRVLEHMVFLKLPKMWLLSPKLPSWTRLERELHYSWDSQLSLVREAPQIQLEIQEDLLLSFTLRREITIWLVTIHQFSLSTTQLNSQISFTLKRETQQQTWPIQTWSSISGNIHQRPFIKLPFFSLIEELLMAIDLWTDTAHTLLNGLMPLERSTLSNIISKQIRESRTLPPLNKIKWRLSKKISQLLIFMTPSLRKISHPGLGLYNWCQRKTLPTTDSMYLISPRSGHIVIIHFIRLVRWPWIETQRTTMLKLSKPLSHQAIWFQELNHQWIRCSREDFSHILILIDTDLERTTIKFQSTAHTEQELIHTSEMVQPALTVTMVDNQTTSQIASMDQRKTHPRPGINSKYQER